MAQVRVPIVCPCGKLYTTKMSNPASRSNKNKFIKPSWAHCENFQGKVGTK